MVFGNISYISIIIHEKFVKNVMNLVIPWLKEISSTHSFEFLTGSLNVHGRLNDYLLSFRDVQMVLVSFFHFPADFII